MATIRCEASGCQNTDAGGKIFFQCGHCRRWWCSSHARTGMRCPACQKGFTNR